MPSLSKKNSQLELRKSHRNLFILFELLALTENLLACSHTDRQMTDKTTRSHNLLTTVNIVTTKMLILSSAHTHCLSSQILPFLT